MAMRREKIPTKLLASAAAFLLFMMAISAVVREPGRGVCPFVGARAEHESRMPAATMPAEDGVGAFLPAAASPPSPSPSTKKCTSAPPTPAPGGSVAALRLINVTDTYKFDNLASLRTLVAEKGAEGVRTETIMSGDFLAPYLLSSYDEGEGMMRLLNAVPASILTWGNHDINDLSDAAVMKREREYTAGVWINSNMTEHPTFEGSTSQVKHHVIEVESPDGTNRRRIGLLGVITDDPKLFKNCNPGMAKWGVQDPWECLREMKKVLENEPYSCDLVVPVCHLYEKEDHKTCERFDFPLVLSGHDHHVVDEVVHGTRLMKAGSDCDKAVIVDISWGDADAAEARIDTEHVTVADWDRDPSITAIETQCMAVLEPLKNTQLAEVPGKFWPLSTVNERGFFGGFRHAMERGTQCTMVQFILSLLRDAINGDDTLDHDVDAVFMKGGNVKCSQTWEPGAPFTLAMLFSLWSPEKECHVFTIPGRVLEGAFTKSYDRPHNGWIHYDDRVEMDADGLITHVGGERLHPARLYRIASGNDFARASDGAAIGDYLAAHPEHMPNKELALPVSFIIIRHAVKTIWARLWEALDEDGSGDLSREELARFDADGDGNLDKGEILAIIKDHLDWRIDPSQDTLVDRIFEDVGLEGDAADSTLSLEKLNELYAAHQGRSYGKWYCSRASGVYSKCEMEQIMRGANE